jgi:uncharacterized PurR-regulated membrane protein YhhQ (DUF165 family)
MKFIAIYIIVIMLTNFGFAYVPLIDLGFGLFSPMAIVAGAVFVARDFAQRAAGHYVLAAMLVGCALSFFMADPYVAIASLLAFGTSELVDWLIYTLTKKPFHKRVLISSAVATPIDTLVFLSFIDILTPGTFVLMVIAKILTSVGIYYYGEFQQRRLATDA